MQEMHAGSAYLCGAPTEMYFGLGAAVEVEVVVVEVVVVKKRVVWPRPYDIEQTLTDTDTN
jgi:hypothetical protein|tara:strand:+ start:256 stop:438 length:183 start_codon:yes stop_codon:yes gene_type:complete